MSIPNGPLLRIGQQVTDGQNVGTLQAIVADWEDPTVPVWKRRPVTTAFVRASDGLEWTARPADLSAVPDPQEYVKCP